MKNKNLKMIISLFAIFVLAIFTLTGCAREQDLQTLITESKSEVNAEFLDKNGKAITKVTENQDLTIKIDVPEGQEIVSFLVDGEEKKESLKEGIKYDFKFDGKKLPKFQVKYATKTFKVDMQVTNATWIVKPANIDLEKVEYNTNIDLQFTANEDYNIPQTLTVNGKEENLLPENKFTLRIVGPTTIKLDAVAKEKYKLDLKLENATCTVEPSELDLNSLKFNTQLKLKFTANDDYKLPQNILVNNTKQELQNNNTYEFNITENTTIELVALSIEYSSLNFNVENASYEITPEISDLSKIKENTQIQVKFIANINYKLPTSFTFNGAEKELDSTHTFTFNITQNTTIVLQAIKEYAEVTFELNGSPYDVDDNIIVLNNDEYDREHKRIKVDKFLDFSVNPDTQRKVSSITINDENATLVGDGFTKSVKHKITSDSIVKITLVELNIVIDGFDLNSTDLKLVGLNEKYLENLTELPKFKLGDELVFEAPKTNIPQLYYPSFHLNGKKNESFSTVTLKKYTSEENFEEKTVQFCFTIKIVQENNTISFEYKQYIQIKFSNQLDTQDNLEFGVENADNLLQIDNKKLVLKDTNFYITVTDEKIVRKITSKVNSEPVQIITDQLVDKKLTLVATDNDATNEHEMIIKFYFKDENFYVIQLKNNLYNFIQSNSSDNKVKNFIKKTHNTLDEISIAKNSDLIITINGYIAIREQDTNGNFEFKILTRLIINGVDRTKELFNSAEFKIDYKVTDDVTIVVEAEHYKKTSWNSADNIKQTILKLDDYKNIILKFNDVVGVEGSGKEYVVSQTDFDNLTVKVNEITNSVNTLPEEMTKANMKQAVTTLFNVRSLITEIKTLSGK